MLTAKVSESFQRYINDGLAEVEERMQQQQEGEAAGEDGGGWAQPPAPGACREPGCGGVVGQ